MTQGEEKLVCWQRGMVGSFYTALFDLIAEADDINKLNLSKGFLEEVDAFKRYQNESGAWEQMQHEFDKG